MRELKWNFEEWFNHNKKLFEDFKEKFSNTTDKQIVIPKINESEVEDDMV